MTRVLIVLALLAAISLPVAAQRGRAPLMSSHPVGSDVVDRIGPEEIQDVRHAVAPDARGAIFPNSIDGRAQYILNIRRDASEPERHDEWDDIMIIQHGYGQLDYGRSIRGGARYAEGEWRGGTLADVVTTLDLAPGVVVRIPARVPHVIRPLGAAPLVYLVLKEKVSAEGRTAR